MVRPGQSEPSRRAAAAPPLPTFLFRSLSSASASWRAGSRTVTQTLREQANRSCGKSALQCSHRRRRQSPPLTPEPAQLSFPSPVTKQPGPKQQLLACDRTGRGLTSSVARISPGPVSASRLSDSPFRHQPDKILCFEMTYLIGSDLNNLIV